MVEFILLAAAAFAAFLAGGAIFGPDSLWGWVLAFAAAAAALALRNAVPRRR